MTPADTPPPYTAADYYGFFLEGLRDIIVDAQAARMEPAGIALLRQAGTLFEAEFQRRHPAAAAIPAAPLPIAGGAPGKPVYRHVLGGTIDDAEASEADPDGIDLLLQADALLWTRTPG